jgi:hypothetical protein
VPFVPWHGAPRFRGAPRDAKKIWIAGGPRVGARDLFTPFLGWQARKQKGRHPQSFAYTPPPVHNPGKIPWSGPPRSFGMGPPNVLIRAWFEEVRVKRK